MAYKHRDSKQSRDDCGSLALAAMWKSLVWPDSDHHYNYLSKNWLLVWFWYVLLWQVICPLGFLNLITQSYSSVYLDDISDCYTYNLEMLSYMNQTLHSPAACSMQHLKCISSFYLPIEWEKKYWTSKTHLELYIILS